MVVEKFGGRLNLDELRTCANLFRKAILETDACRLPISFAGYPRGACGDASILLGQFLYDKGFGVFDYVSGWRKNQSHAWLEKEEVIIDITADQFFDIEDDVIVTLDKTWHQQFKEDSRHQVLIEIYDEGTIAMFKRVYKEIIAHVGQG